MPDLNDFFAFKHTSDEENSNGSGGCGFSLISFIVVLCVLAIIGKIFF